jgi:hypothetical protein
MNIFEAFFKKFIKKPHKKRYNVTTCISDGYDRLGGGCGPVEQKIFQKYQNFLLTYSTSVEYNLCQ